MDDLSPADFARLLAFRTGLRRFERWSEAQARSVGLSPAQHQLLLAVKGHGDDRGPTVGELAEYLLLKPHSAGELIDRAAHAGLVARTRTDTDARVVRILLTEEGDARLHQLTNLHVDELRRLAPTLRYLAEGLSEALPTMLDGVGESAAVPGAGRDGDPGGDLDTS